MTVAVDELVSEVDEKYVGMRPNTGRVKPAHIANGLFRSILGQVASTGLLNRFVFCQSHKGAVPKGHELQTVFGTLQGRNGIDSRVTSELLQELRHAVRGVVNADGTVFTGGMESYSAGSAAFISRDRIGQDAGEFVGGWLKLIKSPLLSSVQDSLTDHTDFISALCAPLLERDLELYEAPPPPRQIFGGPRQMTPVWKGLSEAANTLSRHIARHPDKLIRLRLAALFAGVVVMRHLMALELRFVPDGSNKALPIVADYGQYARYGVRDAAKQSLAKATQSVARFYAWALADGLRDRYSAKAVGKLGPPTYKGQQVKGESSALWLQARESSRGSDKFGVLGEALYDILALEAETDPAAYLRALGRNIGIVQPPGGVTPWFAPRQDITLLLLHCAAEPGESLGLSQLLERLWDRFGIVVGGRSEDEQILQDHNILSWDRDLLKANGHRFTSDILAMDFASHLADGVLAIKVGS